MKLKAPKPATKPAMKKSGLFFRDDILPSYVLGITLPETNIAPARKLPQKLANLPTIHFQVRTVSFREGIS